MPLELNYSHFPLNKRDTIRFYVEGYEAGCGTEIEHCAKSLPFALNLIRILPNDDYVIKWLIDNDLITEQIMVDLIISDHVSINQRKILLNHLTSERNLMKLYDKIYKKEDYELTQLLLQTKVMFFRDTGVHDEQDMLATLLKKLRIKRCSHEQWKEMKG